MARIERTVHIDAPVEAVFEYSAKVASIPEWYTSLLEVRNASAPRAATGVTYEWSFKMIGARFDGTAEYTQVIPNERSKSRTEGGIPSQWDFAYERDGGGTKLTVSVDYTVPGKLLGKIADKLFIERRNASDLEHSIANLKAHCEAMAKVPAQAAVAR